LILPNMKKFHTTLMERTYYDLLRLFSRALDQQNVVLLSFGFSFADEHILDLTRRALRNPTSHLIILAYDEASATDYQTKFAQQRNVTVLSPDPASVLDFPRLNAILSSILPATPNALAYTRNKCLTKNKQVIKLSTRNASGDKIPLGAGGFNDIEIVSILADATEKTQKPFLKRALSLQQKVVSSDDPLNYTRNILKSQITQILQMSDIHRLINQKDLQSIASAVSYIDKLTEESIPTLPTGTCIFSGIAGQMPLKLEIFPLDEQLQPRSSTRQFKDIVPAVDPWEG
jgi:hypothetical protein